MALAEKRQIIEAIEKSVNPLIIIPQTLEGDAIGGALALFLALKKIGKNPRIACPGAVPEKFLFLPESGAIEGVIEKERIYQLTLAAGEHKIKEVSYEQGEGTFNIYFNAEAGAVKSDSLKITSRFKYDLILTIAVRGLESLGGMYSENKELFSALDIINIDNIEASSRFGKINAVDNYYPSVSEVIAEIIQAILPLGYGEKIATALLAGIIFRTDNFQSSVIKPETFALAGSLLASGAQRMEIIRNFYGIDLGSGRSGQKEDLLDSPKAEIVGMDIAKEVHREEGILMALPIASNIAGSAETIGRTFYRPDILADRFRSFRFGAERLFWSLRRLYFWIILSVLLVAVILRMWSLNNIFLGINNFWVRISASISDARGMVAREGFKLFLTQETNSDLKSPNSAVIYSASKAKKKNIGLPVKLSIARLGIEAQFQEVGLDASGTMETPADYKNVGWFNLGPRPGEVGKAVATGHLDTVDTANGVFRRLNELGAGDDVYVTDSENNKLHFRVVSSRVYDAKNAPMEEIFGSSKKAQFNLITCDGVWDRKALSYDKRLVVFTELVSET